jgi:SAM-dependent methyltransferase
MNKNENIDHAEYFQYLLKKSMLGKIYRHHFLYPRLVKMLHGKCLDIGCGVGDMLSFRNDTVGVDVNPNTIAYCKQAGLNAHLMQPNKIPMSDGDFDSVLLDNVIEHITDPLKLLKEIRRILSKDGTLLIGVPGIRGWASDADHKVYYDEAILKKCVEAVGFKGVKTIHMPLWQSEWLSRRVRQYCIYVQFKSIE